MHSWRRALPAVIAAALAVGLSAPAAAAPATTTTIASSTWGYVDRADSTSARIDPEGNAPLGHWTRGHIGRSYFTFPLEDAVGRRFTSAAVTGREVWGRCDRRVVEVRRTDPLTRSHSFATPPRVHEKLAELRPAADCATFSVDVTAALRAAVGRADATMTVELRVPAPRDIMPQHARMVGRDVSLVLTYDGANTPPDVPTDPRILHPDLGCATEAPGPVVNPDLLNGSGEVYLSAAVTDPDPDDRLTAEFTRWPLADPTARRSARYEVEGGRATGYTYGMFDAEGGYAWTVRAHDGIATSAPTAPCYLTVDRTAPAEPTVTSEVYPPAFERGGGVGVPGEFVFASASDDVVAYAYRFRDDSEWSSVPADVAKVIHVPTDAGSNGITVSAVDRAGNRSIGTYYGFEVLENRPMVFSPVYHEDMGPSGGIGMASEFRLTSNLPGTTAYTYRFGDGPETTVAAVDRAATVPFTPTRGGEHVLTVRSADADGVASPARAYRFVVDDRPTVTQTGNAVIGSPVRFALSPRLPDTVSYTYRFDYWEGEDEGPVTIPANADGTAEFTWTPTQREVSSFHVYATDAAGNRSLERYKSMSVDGAAPEVTRVGAETPVQPGTFTFRTTMVDPVQYEYWFSHDQTRRTVAADADGRASVTYTPDTTGWIYMSVRARNAAGIWSETGGPAWAVSDKPGVASAEFAYGKESAWRAGSFTFTANQVDAVEFKYTINGTVRTAPVGPDGKATVQWSPQKGGWQHLIVVSRTASGAESEDRIWTWSIIDRPEVTSAEYPERRHTYAPPNHPGTFRVTPTRPGVADYVYRFSNGSQVREGVVAATADGSATIAFTPPAYGDWTLQVQSRADGVLSTARYYEFWYYASA